VLVQHNIDATISGLAHQRAHWTVSFVSEYRYDFGEGQPARNTPLRNNIQMDLGRAVRIREGGSDNKIQTDPLPDRDIRGKSDRVPTLRLLERLHSRKEFLIESHHPLRETLMLQTGTRADDRIRFLNEFHLRALSALIHQWEPAEQHEGCI
jgi:hypothetical protein